MHPPVEATSSPQSALPCTWQPAAACEGCQAKGKVMCRFEGKDMLHFFMLFLPFGLTPIAGSG